MIHPKPRKRIRATPNQWQALREEKLGACRGCGGWRSMTLAHLVGRDQSGDDAADNLVPLCMGPGSPDCHGKVERREPGWTAIAGRIRASLTEEEVRYVLERKSLAYLDSYFPALWVDAA